MLLETTQTTTEKRLAGLLVLLHLLRRQTKTIMMNTNDDGGEGGARLARLAFARLDEAHAEKLGRALREANRGEQGGAHNMGWQQLDLEISVCAALAQMSPEVARDPKLATMASSYLGACAQSPSEVKPQTLEAALDLGLHSISADAAGSPEAVALVARVACEACASIYVGGSSGAAFPASGPKALRLAWASLRALGHHGRSSLSPAPTDFHRVASALTSALEVTGRGDAAPIEAARALSLWLEPVHAAAMLSSEEGSAYVARLKRALAKLAVTTGTRCQPECVSVAASLAGALGPRFALDDPEEGRPLRPEGLPFLSLLTAKTEISLLLSDALQVSCRATPPTTIRRASPPHPPSRQARLTPQLDTSLDQPGEAVAADFGQTLEGLTMTAGERCAQRLPPCLALLEHSLEVLVECERGGGGGGGKASQDLCAYFELAHEVVGVVGQFLRERAKAEGFGDMAGEGSVELACCRALGGFLMECPEAAGEAGKGVGGGLVAATELGPPRELGQVAAQSSALFGWTYLAPSLSLLREESTPVELSGASLRQVSDDALDPGQDRVR